MTGDLEVFEAEARRAGGGLRFKAHIVDGGYYAAGILSGTHDPTFRPITMWLVDWMGRARAGETPLCTCCPAEVIIGPRSPQSFLVTEPAGATANDIGFTTVVVGALCPKCADLPDEQIVLRSSKYIAPSGDWEIE